MATTKKNRLATITVHAGSQLKQNTFLPTVPPIHHSSTYRYNSMDELDAVFEDNSQGYCYTRYGNPTVTLFEEAVAELENADAAIAFASGMGAIHCALVTLASRPDSPIVVARDIYGATYGLASNLLKSQGRPVYFADMTDLASVEDICAKIDPEILLCETVSNPLLRLVDIQALSEISKKAQAHFVVDNTFASPILVRPLERGADVVIHSATKYLGGHGDALGGVLASSQSIIDRCHETNKLAGATLGPSEAWLLLRGLRTLALRMKSHCTNAAQLANWLEKHDRVSGVYYPGLESHEQHHLAQRIFRDGHYGGMVSFEIAAAGKKEIFHFLDALQICLPVTTLGDVTTALLYPAHSSHRALSSEERRQIGIHDNLVRVSVGIEAIEDIIADLQQALKQTPFA